MLTIDSEPCLSGHDTSLEVEPNIRLDGADLRAGPQGQVVAQLVKHKWVCDGQTHAVLRVASRVRVRFSDGGDAISYGPFEHLRLVDGFVRSGAKQGDILARYDDKNALWFAYPENRFCSQIIVEED